MKYTVPAARLWLAVFLLLCAPSLTRLRAATLQQGLDSILSETQARLVGNVGFVLWDAEADTLLYSRDGQRLHHPASTLKTLTAVSVLHHFGVGHAFTTTVRRSGTNLFVVGGFDPLFSEQDLHALVRQVRKADIREVNWLYADVSLKDTLSRGPGWCWDDTGGDSPLLSPLLIDREGGFIYRFADELRKAGITVRQVSPYGLCPASAEQIAAVEHTLMDVLVPCLKMSDNLYAESLLYQHALLTPGRYDSARDAVGVEKRFLAQLGIGADDCVIVDGSGLSYYNYMSAAQQVSILRFAYSEKPVYYALREALPIGGRDGTLRHRMQNVLLNGRVCAKTGSISSVNALCGYLYVPSGAANSLAGRTLIFSILCDGIPPHGSSSYRDLQERLLLHIAAASYANALPSF